VEAHQSILVYVGSTSISESHCTQGSPASGDHGTDQGWVRQGRVGSYGWTGVARAAEVRIGIEKSIRSRASKPHHPIPPETELRFAPGGTVASTTAAGMIAYHMSCTLRCRYALSVPKHCWRQVCYGSPRLPSPSERAMPVNHLRTTPGIRWNQGTPAIATQSCLSFPFPKTNSVMHTAALGSAEPEHVEHFVPRKTSRATGLDGCGLPLLRSGFDRGQPASMIQANNEVLYSRSVSNKAETGTTVKCDPNSRILRLCRRMVRVV